LNIQHNITSKDIAAISICSALYAAFGYLTSGITFFGIGFLPAVVVPAVFAVVFGPWVGGASGAIGIFIRDMLVHGNAPLSIAAGVPPNFILFFLIGYLATKNISLKQVLIGISLVTAGLSALLIFFLPDMTTYTGLSTNGFLLVFVLTVIGSLAAFTIISIRWKDMQSFIIGAIVGQIAGGLLLSATVWAVSPLFLSYFETPFAAMYVLPLFVWTVATELPFILLFGVPIIKVVKIASPALQYKNKPSKKGETIV